MQEQKHRLADILEEKVLAEGTSLVEGTSLAEDTSLVEDRSLVEDTSLAEAFLVHSPRVGRGKVELIPVVDILFPSSEM